MNNWILLACTQNHLLLGSETLHKAWCPQPRNGKGKSAEEKCCFFALRPWIPSQSRGRLEDVMPANNSSGSVSALTPKTPNRPGLKANPCILVILTQRFTSCCTCVSSPNQQPPAVLNLQVILTVFWASLGGIIILQVASVCSFGRVAN